jgi:carbonic anhydrase/acetyltransferase-like protein (isoleucine patch superfamily)
VEQLVNNILKGIVISFGIPTIAAKDIRGDIKMSNRKHDGVLKPEIHDTVFIAKGAHIYGDVEIAEGSSVWFNAVIRGDEGKVAIGTNSNIQDNAVIHSDMMAGVEIGSNVTVGHGAIIRGCKIRDNVSVGMNSTVMSNSEIGSHSILGANSFVPYNKKFPPRSLIFGVPAKFVRELTAEEIESIKIPVNVYKELIESYSRRRIIGYKEIDQWDQEK